jgi:hypothetical protein
MACPYRIHERLRSKAEREVTSENRQLKISALSRLGGEGGPQGGG